MEKSFEFPAGILTVAKVKHRDKPALRIAMDAVSIHIGYDFETTRDRAFTGFDTRNALAVYSGMFRMVEQL